MQLFTLQNMSILIVASLLFMSAKPFLQGSSRMIEAMVYLFGSKSDPKKRNTGRSSDLSVEYHTFIGDTVGRETLFPGILMFWFVMTSDPLISTNVDMAPATITVIALIFLMAVFRTLGSLQRSATNSPIPFGCTIGSLCLATSFIFGIYSSVNMEFILACAILGLTTSQLVILALRSASTFGPFGIFWFLPSVFAWATRVFASTILAPITIPLTFLEIVLEQPHNPRQTEFL